MITDLIATSYPLREDATCFGWKLHTCTTQDRLKNRRAKNIAHDGASNGDGVAQPKYPLGEINSAARLGQ